MHIRSSKSYYIVDIRPLAGSKKFPKTNDGLKKAKAFLKNIEIEIIRNGSYVDPSRTIFFGSPEKVGNQWLDPDCAVAKYLDYEWKRIKSTQELGEKHWGNKYKALEDIARLDYGNKPMSRVRIGELRSSTIKRDIIPQLWTGRKHATADKKFTIFNHMLDYCKDIEEIIAANPASGCKRPSAPVATAKPKERIDSSVIWRVIEKIEDKKIRLAAEFAAGTGIRAGEQHALTWDDFDETVDENNEKVGLLTIDKAVKSEGNLGGPKNKNAYRTIEFGEDLILSLMEWRVAQPLRERHQNLIFPGDDGYFAKQDNWRETHLYKACRLVGEYFTWHDLRHFYASVLIFTLSESAANVTGLMGHHSLDFTLKQYNHWFDAAKRVERNIGNRMSRAFKQGGKGR
ncbi:integrase [uncultured Mediterranean phage uvDeep-CGR0-AD1-C123]|nr:integrase [uncultured Mediterranean phage uvDeep-CGR0-AD1-C123]